MVRRRLGIVGYYGKGNWGDEAMLDGLCRLFGRWDMVAMDAIPSDINQYDALILGGGNILESPYFNADSVTIPIALLGVGFHRDTLPKCHERLIERAKIICARDSVTADSVTGSYLCPDLAFSRPSRECGLDRDKRCVVLLNGMVAPGKQSLDWQHRAHSWFIHEMAESLDTLADSYKIEFQAMCTGKPHDSGISFEVANRMNSPSEIITHFDENSIATASLVISQRFHGCVVPAQNRTPFIAITHHDKIANLCADLGHKAVVQYYGFRSSTVNDALSAAWVQTESNKQITEGYRQAWHELSVIVEAKLFG